MSSSSAIELDSTELLRLLAKVEQRLQFHREAALGFAAIRGAIETELSRRETI